jgi:hypothetical protein
MRKISRECITLSTIYKFGGGVHTEIALESCPESSRTCSRGQCFTTAEISECLSKGTEASNNHI